MNSREAKNRALHSSSPEELESPFLEEELFIGESEAEGEVRFERLIMESPFQHANEKNWAGIEQTKLEGVDSLGEEVFSDSETGIIDGDNRVRVKKTEGVPWRWICKIAIKNNQGRYVSGGTGVLISHGHVLTAAHVVYQEYIDPYNYSIEVTPALNENDEPFGMYSVSGKLKIPKRYDPKAKDHLDWDYALIPIKKRVGEKRFSRLGGKPLCYWGHPSCGANTFFQRLNPQTLNGKAAFTAGYPGRKGGKQLWCASGILHSVHRRRRTMWMTADTTKGQSGSPVWVMEKERYCLVGIAAGGGEHSNSVVRVTRELIRQVRSWISEDGDTPSWTETREVFEPYEIELGETEEFLRHEEPLPETEVPYYAEEELLAPEREVLLGHFDTEEKAKDESEAKEQLEVLDGPVMQFQRDQFELEENGTEDVTPLEEGFSRLPEFESWAEEELLEYPYSEGEALSFVEGTAEAAEEFLEAETRFAEEEPLALEEAELAFEPEDEESKITLDEEGPAEPFDELTGEEGKVFFQEELTPDGVNRAIRLNARYAKKLGWEKYRGSIESYLLEFWVASMWPESDFPKAVARWQKRHGLKPDGIIGPKSWKRMKVLLCLGYEPGEVAKSRTQSGHLKQDVFMTKGGWLVIADFAVGRSEVKASTRGEKLLREWLEKFEAAPPDEILITGLSDCVGEENNNEALRRTRAIEVAKLIGPKVPTKIRFYSGKMGKYWADNLTPASRAMNRSVLIQWKRHFEFAPEKVEGDAAKIMTKVIRCAALAAVDIPGKPGERIRKMLSIAEHVKYPGNLQLWYYAPEPMWRYFSWRTDDKERARMTSATGGRMPFDGHAHPHQWRVYPFKTMARKFVAADISSCPAWIRRELIIMHNVIEESFERILQQLDVASAGFGTLSKGAKAKAFLYHLDDLRGTPDHLYSAFK
nr:trypsin-like peptidase domain-containing protein [Nitrosomonas nitrosa]